MFNSKNNFPKNIDSIFQIIYSGLSSLRLKPKSYFSGYLTHIFSDLLSKSSVYKDYPENTNNSITSNFISFYFYLNLPYYPSSSLYKSLSPLTFDKFIYLVHTIYFGGIDNLLKFIFNFLSTENKGIVYKSHIYRLLTHFYINNNLNNAFYNDEIHTLEEIVNTCITQDQLNYNQWRNISTEVNSDVFLLILYYLFKSCEIFKVENLNLYHKINNKFEKNDKKNLGDNNSISSTANNLFQQFDNINSKLNTKLNVDVSELLFNFLCKSQNYNLEYIDPNDLNASYNSDMEVLEAFDNDKEEVFKKLYESSISTTSEKKTSKKFANMTLAGGNNLMEMTGFNDTIVGGGINLKMQTLGGDELQNSLLNHLKVPGIKPQVSNNSNNNNFSNVSKFEGYIYINKKLNKIKFYLINKDLFIVDENGKLILIINLTSNCNNTKIIYYKDNEKIKDNKYLLLKLYGNNNFFFNEKDKAQAKDFIKLLYQRLNISISTHNENYNFLSSLNGKYEADETKEIMKYNSNNFIKIYQIKEINDIFLKKKDLYLKMIYKKNNNILEENYLYEIVKKLSSTYKEFNELGIKLHDKYENSVALYLIYNIQPVVSNGKGINLLTLKNQISYIRTISHFIYHLHLLGLCLNCTYIDINIRSPVDFLSNYFLSDHKIIFCDEKQKIPHNKLFGYCPPEVLNGEESNNKIDLWFLGNLIYYTLFKKLPFYDQESDMGNCHIFNCIFNREITFDDMSTKITSSTTSDDNLNELYEIIIKCLNVDYTQRGNSQDIFNVINKIYKNMKK